MSLYQTSLKDEIERLKEIGNEIDKLYKEKSKLVNGLPENFVYQNPDGTWTRFTKIDNLDELMEKGQIFRSHPITRFTSKIDILKNKPK